MKRLLHIPILVFGLYGNTFSQKTDAMLFGDVKDENHEHIPFAHIIIKGTNIGTAADESGHFVLSDLPTGKVMVIAEAMGYKSQEKVVVMKANSSTEVYFVLKSNNFLLNEIVVSADRTEINRKEAPVMINVLSPKIFESTYSSTMADGINFTPGLRVENNCQNCGFTQVRMNGLPGPYTQILLNSKNIFSGLAGVYGLEQIPTSIIDRIEVVRGGGSALFGSNAIGGTINIITKDPVRNTYEINTSYGIVGVGYAKPTTDVKLDFNVANVGKTHKTGFIAYGSTRNRNSFDANDDGYSEIPILKNSLFGINTYYKLNTRTKVEVNYRVLHDFRRGGNKFDLSPHQTDITEQTEHYINTGDFSADIFTNRETEDKLSFFFAFQNINRNSYYGANKDPNAYGNTTNLTTNTGIQYFHHFSNNHKLVSGIDNIYDHLKDNKFNNVEGLNIALTQQEKITNGLFLQDELKYGKFKFSTGIRFDSYEVTDKTDGSGSVDGKKFVPRFTVLYSPTENFQIRTGYAMGYRSPQVFDEDLHIESSGAKSIYHINSPYLKEETSDSYTISTEINGIKWFVNYKFTLEGFYTILHNPFATKIMSLDTNGNMIYERYNATNGAFVKGANAELFLVPLYNLKIQAGVTFQQSLYNKPEQWSDSPEKTTRFILRAPSSYGYLTSTYTVKKDWDFSLSGTWTGPMYTIHTGTSPDVAGLTSEETTAIREAIARGDIIAEDKLVKTGNFYDVGIQISYRLKLNKVNFLKFSVALKNILNSYQTDFDKGLYRDAGYVYGAQLPRSIYLSVKYGLN